VKTPLVSVVIPTFNNASLLAETLDGVKRQTLKDLEVIVIDDGSTDNTAEVVKGYDPQIVYCYQPNQRQAAARNRGVHVARGNYVAFCDHDDIWNERHLESLLHCFGSFPDTAMAFDNAEYFGHGIKTTLHLHPDISESLNHKKINLNYLLWKYPVASMSVMMVKKAPFQRLQGLSERVGVMDDYHLYLRLATHWDLRYVNYVGCKKRVSESNLSRLENLKEMNLTYLEDIRDYHPEVIRKIGAVSFRLRLARKYFKLGRFYAQNAETQLAKETYWKAYVTNLLNPRYFLSYMRVAISSKHLGRRT
jgi:glycosyltransferase involved in cell wall biosynthesis